MLSVLSQLVCDQIVGADGGQPDPSKTHSSGTLAEWRGTEFMPETHNPCVCFYRHDHTCLNPR